MADSISSPLLPTWLVLGADELAASLAALVPEAAVRSMAVDGLAEALAGHPRLIAVAQPPTPERAVEAVAAERLRPRSQVRTVLLTPADDLGRRLAALEGGFDDALPVSMDVRELAARLRRLVAAARPTGRRGAIPVGAGIELDLAAHELRNGGLPQRLRPKEFQLLALLATHPRRAFSRSELIERVWGPTFEGDPRTIDVHLRWLRTKIEADPEHPVQLMTVRGHGYRFDPPR